MSSRHRRLELPHQGAPARDQGPRSLPRRCHQGRAGAAADRNDHRAVIGKGDDDDRAGALRMSAEVRSVRPGGSWTLSYAPATPDRLDDLAAVMAESGAAKNCWCAYWYLGNAEYKARWGAANREPLTARVTAGEEPGLIAYADDRPVAWVSVAPRANFARLNRSRTFAPIDALPVWAVNCFVVAKTHRR